MTASSTPRPTIVKRHKRGRREQRSPLSAQMRHAAQKFANQVGPPRFAPQGHRDFQHWLVHIRSPQCRPFWKDLSRAMGREIFFYPETASVRLLRQNIVREVIRHVVHPRRYESPKLVKITAYRHTASSESGSTLLSVFESHLKFGMENDDTANNPVSCTTPLLSDQEVDAEPSDANDVGGVVPYPKETHNIETQSRNQSLAIELPPIRDLTTLLQSRIDKSRHE